MIQFNPQPLDELKKRFSIAMQKSWSVEKVSENLNNRPGNKQENVFDFEDGIRLIVSRDSYKGKEVIHVSASFDEKICKIKDISSALAKMYGNFVELSGIKTTPLYQFFSDKGVPHWIIEFSNLN